MARRATTPYKITGGMLFIGDTNQVQVSLTDIPRETIDTMALKFLAQKLTKIVTKGGYPEAQRLAQSICRTGRVTRKFVERLPEETVLKACLVNYAREKQGVMPLDLSEAAAEFDSKIGSVERISKSSEPYLAARKRADQILFAYRK